MAPLTSTHGRLSRQVLKVMGIFCSVHIISIVCSLVRTKLVAIWLGPTGMGLFGIYNSVIETAASLSQLGTGTGMVRALAMSPRENLPKLVAATRRWGFMLGLAAAIIMVCASPWLSRFTFGDNDHIIPFIILAAGVMLLALSNTEGSVFQGLRQYSALARSSVLGAGIGLIVTVPMFRIWGIDSIIPAILTYIVITWICRGLYRARTAPQNPPLTLRETFVTGKDFAILGLFITITMFATNAVSYVFMSYLNREAGIATAGLYQAGFTLVNRYVGIIMTAIGMEYLPRLSEVSRHPHRIELFLSHETQLITLVMFPAVALFICADKAIINILYDRSFMVMLPFVTWAIAGTVLRAWSWCMAFVILARGDGVAYLVTELLSALVAITLNILFYDLMGIEGLGYAYILWYAFYTAEVWIVCRMRYAIRPRPTAVIVPLTALILSIASALMRSYIGWLPSLIIFIAALIMSYRGLRRLLGASPLTLLRRR